MDKFPHDQSSNKNLHVSSVGRPNSLPTVVSKATEQIMIPYTNLDQISLTPSPMNNRPHVFQAGTLFDSNTYEQILSSVQKQSNKSDRIKAIDDDEDDEAEEEDTDLYSDKDNTKDSIDQQYLRREREQELQHLSRVIRNSQLNTDSIAHIIMQQLNSMLEMAESIQDNKTLTVSSNELAATATTHPYPPINQTGDIRPHDRPHAAYGHLDRQTLAQEFHFNLQQPTRRQTMRYNAKTFAITSWTNVSKDDVMNYIKDEFGIEEIQYICISEEQSELNHRRHLHIQIIFKEKINRRKPFLDQITQTHCNYQVTQNDCAWNEYIKKGGDYIEFGTFQSTTQHKQKQWPSSQSTLSSSSSSSSSLHTLSHLSVHPTRPITINTTDANTTTVTTTARAQAEQKRHHKETIAKDAMNLAKKNVDMALKYMKDNLAWEFIHHFEWYKAAFNYIYLQEVQERDRRRNLSKQYTWPDSFPDCTSELRQVVDRWIREEFSRTSRAKCLILIGPTGTGKTTFAKSLPGQYNYFKGRWRLDSWHDSARYSIFDDIDWDKFEQLGFPSKKDLLTQNGLTIATDKYKKSREINVEQPTIVLLNPGRPEGSLTAVPTTNAEQEDVNYWQQRAIIYRMGPNEYFHKPDYYQDNVNN